MKKRHEILERGFLLLDEEQQKERRNRRSQAMEELQLELCYMHYMYCPGCAQFTIGCDCCGGGLTLRDKGNGFCCYPDKDSYEAAVDKYKKMIYPILY